MTSIGPTGGQPHQPSPILGSSPSGSSVKATAVPAATSFAGSLLSFYGNELGTALAAYTNNPTSQSLLMLAGTLKAMESDIRDGGELIDKIKQARASNPPLSLKDVGNALQTAYSLENRLVMAQAAISNATNVGLLPDAKELESYIGTVSQTPDPNAEPGTVWGDMQVINNALAPTQKPPPPFFPIPSTATSPSIQGDTAHQAASTIQSQSIANIQAAFAAYQADPSTGTQSLLQALMQAEQDLRSDNTGLIETLEASKGTNPDSKLMGAIAQSYALGSAITAAENLLITAGQSGTTPDMGALSQILGTQNSTSLNTIWGNINSIVSWLGPNK